jgi:hypothetical protein
LSAPRSTDATSYLVPSHDGSYDGLLVRHDTTQPFAAKGSWTTFDVSTVNPRARGFAGAVFDGRYVYLVPFNDDAPDFSGVVARYDTTAVLAAPSSWTTFDVSTVNPSAKGFYGATFDGRCLYLAPYENGTGTDGVVARYDTTAAFGAEGSWSTFDVSTVNTAANLFYGVVFDGRYLDLVPSTTGVLARFDTTAPSRT